MRGTGDGHNLLFGPRAKGPGEQIHPEMQKILDEKEAKRLELIEREEFEKEGGTITLDEEGDTMWEDKHGNLHREHGPAMIYEDGSREWYRFGVLHRLDGPAVEWKNREKWYKDGRLHREDGPAVRILSDGKWKEQWFLNDREYTEEEFFAR